jgi:hypothetical protein
LIKQICKMYVDPLNYKLSGLVKSYTGDKPNIETLSVQTRRQTWEIPLINLIVQISQIKCFWPVHTNKTKFLLLCKSWVGWCNLPGDHESITCYEPYNLCVCVKKPVWFNSFMIVKIINNFLFHSFSF